MSDARLAEIRRKALQPYHGVIDEWDTVEEATIWELLEDDTWLRAELAGARTALQTALDPLVIENAQLRASEAEAWRLLARVRGWEGYSRERMRLAAEGEMAADGTPG